MPGFMIGVCPNQEFSYTIVQHAEICQCQRIHWCCFCCDEVLYCRNTNFGMVVAVGKCN